MKGILELTGVLVGGALLGSFLGKFAAIAVPYGRTRDLLSTDITAGLHPTNIDLRVIDVTIGLLFRLNVMSIAGILLAAYLYKRVLK